MFGLTEQAPRSYIIRTSQVKFDMYGFESWLAIHTNRGSTPHETQLNVRRDVINKMISLTEPDEKIPAFKVLVYHINPDPNKTDDYRVNVERVEMEELVAQAKTV